MRDPHTYDFPVELNAADLIPMARCCCDECRRWGVPIEKEQSREG